MFAPIHVQHAAAEGHLKEREERCSGEGRRGERQAVRVGVFLFVCFLSYQVAHITKVPPTLYIALPNGAASGIYGPPVGRDKPTALVIN